MGWWVYLLRCGDGSLYAGITTDPQRRLDEHRRGVASRYTRARRPVALAHVEPSASKSSALRREAAIKRLSRAAKERLVAGSDAGTDRTDRARSWVERLGLAPHPEGGWYRETWRSPESVTRSAGDRTARPAATSIYFLLREGEVSRLHRIRSDETWFLHDGGPLIVHVFDDAGHRAVRLARAPEDRGEPQATVPAGAWFGAELAPGAGFALVGCGVAPGFEFADLEFAGRRDLARRFPAHAAVVRRLTPRRAASCTTAGSSSRRGRGSES